MNVNEEDEYGFQDDIGFSRKAKLEVNVNWGGVCFVGNTEGYLALARFCTLLAERYASIRLHSEQDDEDGWGEYHLCDFINDDAKAEGRFVFSPGPVRLIQQTSKHVPDILFYLSETVGPEFWGEEIESGADAAWLRH